MLSFGNTPVPWTASWSGENLFYVDRCQFADGRPAICQSSAPGVGRPLFGKPHMIRQRQAIVLECCDLCARPLKGHTRVSLSHARPQPHAAKPGDILQVEPLLHRECAATSMRFCPALQRDVRNGTAMIHQVFRSRVQLAISDPKYVGLYVPGYVAKPDERIIGHAKVQLLRAQSRDEEWLARSAARPDSTSDQIPL
jgi:hypothetical protein